MNPFLKAFLFFLISFLIGACGPSSTQIQASLGEMSKRYSGRACESLNGEVLRECKKKCEEMYRKIRDRNECRSLKVNFIEDLYEAYKILERANNLDDIDPDIFASYININPKGIESLEYIIEDYTSGEAKEFLFWLIDEEEIAEIFKIRDNNFNTLETLFREMDPNYDKDELYESFTKKIGGEFLIEIIINSGEENVEWFMDFINEKNPDCFDDEHTKECFKLFCEIGDRLDETARDNWLNYERFEKYINKIIDEKVNSQQGRNFEVRNPRGWIHEDSPSTRRDRIGKIDDFDEDWVEELCIGGII